MNARSIHDNLITSYSVFADPPEIRLNTCFKTGEGKLERTDVIFSGVAAYFFYHDSFGTILFSIDEVPLTEILETYAEHFVEGVHHGWPGPWNTSGANLLEYLTNRQMHAWSLSVSYGMEGWVVAQQLNLVSANDATQ